MAEKQALMRIAVIALMLWVLPIDGTAQNGESGAAREEFTAVALSTGGPRSDPVAAQLDIVIERWSTEAERQRPFSALGKGRNTIRTAPGDASISEPAIRRSA